MTENKIITLRNENGEVLAPRTGAAAVFLANGKSVETALNGCWIEFADADGNPTDEPYIHWYAEEPDVEESEVPSVTLITFTIVGTSYQAEEGMTWGEWIESEYNSSPCFIEGVNVKYSDEDWVSFDSRGVSINDTIIEGTYYGTTNF